MVIFAYRYQRIAPSTFISQSLGEVSMIAHLQENAYDGLGA